MYDRELILDVGTDSISQEYRKMKVRWSREAQEDLRACHNIDAEKALADIMAREINYEIDKEVLRDLSNNAYTPPPPLSYPVFPLADPEPAVTKKRKRKMEYRMLDDDWEVQKAY